MQESGWSLVPGVWRFLSCLGVCTLSYGHERESWQVHLKREEGQVGKEVTSKVIQSVGGDMVGPVLVG